jgi:hypothetical protein
MRRESDEELHEQLRYHVLEAAGIALGLHEESEWLSNCVTLWNLAVETDGSSDKWCFFCFALADYEEVPALQESAAARVPSGFPGSRANF